MLLKKATDRPYRVILQKSITEINIDLNAKDWQLNTAFILACENGQSEIAEMLVQKSAELNIDLNVVNGSICWVKH